MSIMRLAAGCGWNSSSRTAKNKDRYLLCGIVQRTRSILSFSCEIAKIIQKKCVINGLALPSCPLWEKPLFTAGGKTLINKDWKSQNVTNLGQIVKQGRIMSLNELKANFNLNDM